jgi:predicted Zn-dependent peptidase
LFYDNTTTSDQIMTAVDSVIDRAQTQPIDQATIDRAVVKLRSELYDYMTELGGFGRADLLASFALFDNNPQRINTLEEQFRKVTPEVLQRTAREYLRKTNRTVLVVEPTGAPSSAGGGSKTTGGR